MKHFYRKMVAPMNKKEWLAIIMILFTPLPFSSYCLASLSAKFMNKTSEELKQAYTNDIHTFRTRQIESALLTIILFSISLAIAHFYSNLNLSRILWMPIASAMLLTHTVFNQLGWELTWGGNTLLEMMNKWSFRIIYSIGIILLFITMLR
jgi:hypothetical protein